MCIVRVIAIYDGKSLNSTYFQLRLPACGRPNRNTSLISSFKYTRINFTSKEIFPFVTSIRPPNPLNQPQPLSISSLVSFTPETPLDEMQNVSQVRTRLNDPSSTQTPQIELERQRHSRSSSAELTEPLVFVPQRQRNAVSRREDG